MKHVLITGGTDGLGKLTAQKLIIAGYVVTVLGHDETKTQGVAKEIGCAYVVADVTDAGQVEVAFSKAVEQNGQIDILINNAGIWIEGALETNDPEAIKRTIETNTLGTLYCTRLVATPMKQRKDGRIINVISQGGLYGRGDRSIYAASKWAVTGFTKSMQAEFKPFNVSVAGFYPATMNTQFFDKANSHKDRSTSLDPAIAADALLYICNLPKGIEVPEFGIQDLNY